MTPGGPFGFGSADAPGGRRSRLGRAVAVAGSVCLAAAFGLWGALRMCDVWEPATVVAFGPLRFAALVPSALSVAALVVNRRALWSLVPAAFLAAGPVAGFSIPWDQLGAGSPAGPRVRVLTCNMHYEAVPAGPLDRMIDDTDPDVVVLQEWRERHPSEALARGGWHTHREPGQFLASRHPIRRAERLGADSTRDRENGSVARYELDTPAGVVTVFSVHLASPREGLGEAAAGDLDGVAANSAVRWTQARRLAAAANRVIGPVVVAGDFNTPPPSAIFRRLWGGYEDAFSTAGWGWGYTFRARVSAVRIDHILVGGGGRATGCRVGPDVGSPHRPVLADLVWPADAPGG
jgi:endonuclease/exonuclease/phosphatase (EEP) superfamily protein YafD